jgi:multiple sugar transport system substrate-binding protein
MIVPSSAKEKNGAWAFLDFWTGIDNPNRSAKFYNMGGWLPYSADVANTPTFQRWLSKNRQFKAFLDILGSPNCKAPPPIANYQYLNDLIGQAEDAAVQGTESPKQALDGLAFKFNQEEAKRKALGYDD